MKINEIDDNIIPGPWGRNPRAPKDTEYDKLLAAGFKFEINPGSWDELFLKPLDKKLMGKIQNVLSRNVIMYPAFEVLHLRSYNGQPYSTTKHPIIDREETFVLLFDYDTQKQCSGFHSDENKWNNIEYFLCNTSYSDPTKRFIRCWRRLV